MPQRRGSSRVRSIALRVVVFLLFGAIVNVVVAWGVAIWSEEASDTEIQLNHLDSIPAAFEKIVQPEWMDPDGKYGPMLLLRPHRAFGWRADRLEIWWMKPGISYGAPKHSAYEVRAGWPTESVWCSGYSESVSISGVQVMQGRWRFGFTPIEELGARDMGWSGSERFFRPIPYGVIPLGFAINTLFYGAILWLLFAAPGRVRRWRRIRRGLCAKCAYPIGASDVCTECGAAIRPGGAKGCSHG